MIEKMAIDTDNPWLTVRDGTFLRKLAGRGLINKPPEHCRPRGKSWGGGYAYVDTGSESTPGKVFTFGRHELKLEYQDGCFFPFLRFREREAS